MLKATKFVTVAAEQFGTNIRATVTTTVPNFVRGAVIPMTILYEFLKPVITVRFSALTTAGIALGLAFTGVFILMETFGKDLDYVEAF